MSVIITRRRRASALVGERRQACESTSPPRAGADCIWVENSCRKLLRPDEPPVIPKSAASVSKLDCRVLVELELAVLLASSALEVESVDPLESDWLRLLISLAS
jgi:hypothetical protein